MELANTYLKIDLDAIAYNYRAIQKKVGVPVMAIVKVNAYGHGAIQVSRHLQEQCDFFGVSSVAEGLELRRNGITKPILILGYTPTGAYPILVKEKIRPTIFRYEDAVALSQEATAQGACIPFHFALDTGMSRIGFQATAESAALCAKIAKLPNLIPEGLFSHFATADCADLSDALEQARRFDAFDGMLRKLGVNIPLRHLDNSAGIINFSSHYEMVRAGIILYGLYPSDQVDSKKLKLRPGMSWHSYVSHIKLLEPGRKISYGGTYITQRPTLVATISAGYADGYRRSLSNRFYVLIRGKRAPILGKICMDQMMVDVTNIPDVQIGDDVVLVGSSGSETITPEQFSSESDSFNYEFICSISRRTPRLFYADGKFLYKADYLLDETI